MKTTQDIVINIIIIIVLVVLIYFNDFTPLTSKPGQKIKKYHGVGKRYISARWAEKQDRSTNSCLLWIILLMAIFNLIKK